jgi:hypothetical protein
MQVIEQLKYHENNQLEEWLDYSEKKEKAFYKELVKFAKTNELELRNYCINTTPTEFSSLSIVYVALSEFSASFNHLLLSEIKRVVTLAKEKRINAEYLDLLTDIETEDIYSKDEDTFIECLNFMTSNLDVNGEDDFNIELLEVIDWFIIEYDEDDAIEEVENWKQNILILANEGQPSVKIKAQEVLKNLNVNNGFKSISFIERLKTFFR